MKKQQRLEIAKFCLAGGIAVILGYAILYVLTEYLKLWYVFSSIIAFITSNTISFIIQKFWTFKNKNLKKMPRQFILYITFTVIYFLINTIGIYVLTDICNIYYILSQLILTALLSVCSYFTSRKILK